MRLTTLRLDGAEPGALVRPGGAVPLTALNERLRTDWPGTVQELLERGRVEELRDWVAGQDAARLDDLALPQDQLSSEPRRGRARGILASARRRRHGDVSRSRTRPSGQVPERVPCRGERPTP